MKRSARLLSLAGVGAVLLVAVANGVLVRNTGCAPNAHYALVRSLARGTPAIDRYQWQTCDKSYVGGHFYAAKASGLALAALPLYAALRGLGLAHENLPSVPSWHANGDDTRRGVWPLTLWAAVLPAGILLLLVRRLADELEPGYGTVTALTLGLATLLLPYGSVFFSHALSTCLGFAAFVVLWRERRGPASALRLAAAGLLAGLAVSVEYPLAIVLAALGVYALLRRPLVRRGLAYGAGALAGLLPLLAFSWWAFGSPLRLSYAGAVLNQGQTGHDTLGENASGFFGVGTPSLHVALQLLFSANGLLRLMPVLALAVPGLVLLYRRGARPEALLVAALALAFLVYDSGYWLPFGGDSPGPRFLTPIAPFLAFPLALVFRRLGPTVVVLGTVSALGMLALTATSSTNIHSALSRMRAGHFTETVAGLAGAGSGWVALIPFLAAVLAACALAAIATAPLPTSRRGLEVALAAFAAWLLLDGVAPQLLEDSGALVDGAVIVAVSACGAAVWRVSRDGLPALWRASPLLVLLVPSLAGSPGAVLLASGLALLLLITPLRPSPRPSSAV